MEKQIRFRLNETDYTIAGEEQGLALDWIRGTAGLKGTKEGCREGDCGACLVMLGGSGADGRMEWLSVTSCTLGLGDLDGRHIITIEGLSSLGLTPVMEAMLDEGASQCGFCSPGFVLALTSFLVSGTIIDPVSAMIAVEGNLCRCTGYGSIRRAAALLAAQFSDLPAGLDKRLDVLAERKVLSPTLASLMKEPPFPVAKPVMEAGSQQGKLDLHGLSGIIGGGTDYFVRHSDQPSGMFFTYTDREPDARTIRQTNRGDKAWLEIGCAVTVTDFFASDIINAKAPGIDRFASAVASLPIRNRATLAGNIANASPIADMTAMLIALEARVLVGNGIDGGREIELDRFFLGYKKTDMAETEHIVSILIPSDVVVFNFEKVARRSRLDIACVNSAMAVRMLPDGTISHARLSAGGVAAVPLLLENAGREMQGKSPDVSLARSTGLLAARAGNPQSDVRGSSTYRKRLLERLTWAHFIRLWPDLHLDEELLR